jgi:hypothetical protein
MACRHADLLIQAPVPQVKDLVESVKDLFIVRDCQNGCLLFAGHLA